MAIGKCTSQLLFLCCTVIATCGIHVAAQRTAEDDKKFTSTQHRLKMDLLSDYDKDVFPTRFHNKTLTVQFDLEFLRLDKIDENQQKLTVNAFANMMWADYRLTWNPADYDGISELRLPNALVWKPDITLYNNAGNDPFAQDNRAAIILYSTGFVLYVAPVKLTAHCDFDLTNFPYDSHVCPLQFGSWVQYGFRVNLTQFPNEPKTPEISNLNENTAWTLTDSSVNINIKYFPCCKEPFPDMTYNFTFTRQSSFYSHFYITPGFGMFMLAPFIFFLRPGSASRTLIGLGIMLGSILMTIATYQPTFINRTPEIMVYYTLILTEAVFMMILSYVIDLIWFCTRTESPPRLCRMLLLTKLAKIVCVQVPDFEHQSTHQLSVSQSTEQLELDEDRVAVEQPPIMVHGTVRAEWKALAMVLNRLSFTMYMVVNIVIVMLLFH